MSVRDQRIASTDKHLCDTPWTEGNTLTIIFVWLLVLVLHNLYIYSKNENFLFHSI